MTFQKAKESSLPSESSAEPVEKPKRKKSLNNESTFKNRNCQLAIAEGNRIKSSKRNDVDQISDSKAFNEMFEYIKSDTHTLDTHKSSEIASFYADRSVFITGSSGFVGKVSRRRWLQPHARRLALFLSLEDKGDSDNCNQKLTSLCCRTRLVQCLLEKLLRSCPGLKSVYILMRPKRGKDVAQRMETLVKSELFERLRNSEFGQEQMNKIVAIKGDITEPLFGLSQQDIEQLSSNVSIIFHSAATVKFVEPLSVAVQNNVVSVENLINLASKLNNLEALVHVSTAYSNCDRKQVEEVFYEAPIEADRLIDMSNWMSPSMLEEISPVLLGKRPNTYTYTKAVAESLLLERSRKLLPNVPIAMVRPSIVAGIWQQPIRGWVDNFNGPTGVILSMMTGAIQAMVACPNYCADIVPVDIVANLIICTAWHVHEKQFQKKLQPGGKIDDDFNDHDQRMSCPDNPLHCEQISIFNCVSGTLNPIAWRDFAKYIKQIGLVYPCNNLMRRPGTLLVPSENLFKVFNFINHTMVAYLGDFLLKMAGKKPKLVIIHDRMMKMITTLKPFTTSQWLFRCSNVTCLYEKLSPIDKEIFNFDIRQVRWDDYLRRYYVGSK